MTISTPLQRPRLKADAVPCIFIGCPAYLSSESSSRPSRCEKDLLIEQKNIADALKLSRESKLEYDRSRTFSNLDELYDRELKFKCSSFWDVIRKNDMILYLNIECSSKSTELNYAVTVGSDLQLNVSYKGHRLLQFGKKYVFPINVTDINQVHEILGEMEKVTKREDENITDVYLNLSKYFLNLACEKLEDKNDIVQFLVEQISFLSCKPQKYKYSSMLLVFSSMFYLISPRAYKYIRDLGNLTLPHPNTIFKLCSKLQTNPQTELKDEYFLAYIKEKIKSFKEHERIVSLMVDEVHIKPFFDYKAGNIVGMAHDNKEMASSAFVFMIQSLLSTNKEVVHILPSKKIIAETLHAVLRKIICGLEDIGIKVVVVVTDNNSINRKCMLYFQNSVANYFYPHPCDPLRPLFYAVDTVHLIKCVRNNWLNQKNNEQAMYYPDFNLNSNKVCTASFLTIKNMYEKEHGNILKFGYNLTQKALWTNNLERQNVKLALQVFNPNTVTV